MRRCQNFKMIIWLLMFIFTHRIAAAQQSLAQQAYSIFKANCFDCHGPNGKYAHIFILQLDKMIETQIVIQGDPEGSELYKRISESSPSKQQMPLGKPPLEPEKIETIRSWIETGTPDWEEVFKPKRGFITNEMILNAIYTHVESLPAFDRPFARYFTLTHLYNAGESDEILLSHQNALSKLINSLSWGTEVIKPTPIDQEKTIFYIDLRHYEWDIRNDRWYQIEQAYPYNINFESPMYTMLRQGTNCQVPFVRADWFIATASLPPLYYEILDLPETTQQLEEQLGVDVAENLKNAPGFRVWRAGFNNSGVSVNNRIVERHESRYGAYWKSYDFAGNVGQQNIFAHPLNFKHDGGEIIFNLPNGLQAYYLSNASGDRLDEAPIEIVSDRSTPDTKVYNGLSCMGCHTEGMRTFEDQVRAVVDQNANPSYDNERALRLYAEKSVMDKLVSEDTERYRKAVEDVGSAFDGVEPIQQLVRQFEGTLDAAHAAAEVGLEEADFLQKISENASLQNLGLLVLKSVNGGVKRDTWKSQFSEVISVLDIYADNVQAPDDEPDAPNTSLEISVPDENLRTAVREALGLIESDTITEQKMQGLTTLSLNTAGTSDFINLEGLEHATNLRELSLRVGAGIKDITPLKGLTALTSLYISANVSGPDIDPLRFSDIHPLQDMTALTSLTLDNISQISDLTPLRRLADLTFLRVSGNQISDLTPLQNLTALTQLHVESNQISDLTPLQNLTKLSSLNLAANHISNIAPLENLTKLKILKLHINEITDVSALENLTGLQELSILDNPIEDLTPLRRLKEQNPSVKINIDINVDLNNRRGAPTAPVLPAETALLSNYPNPFNPETWIPYQLAEPADVTLTIYSVDRKLVRSLVLGYQPAGIYQNRSRAAYWDGRNALGEPVTSGVYFYTLKAGDFSATRKMLMRK